MINIQTFTVISALLFIGAFIWTFVHLLRAWQRFTFWPDEKLRIQKKMIRRILIIPSIILLIHVSSQYNNLLMFMLQGLNTDTVFIIQLGMSELDMYWYSAVLICTVGSGMALGSMISYVVYHIWLISRHKGNLSY